MNKNVKIGFFVIIGIILLVLFKGELIFTVAYPDNYQIERQGYDFFHDFLLEQSGVVNIPDGADLSKIYKIIVIVTGCSSDSTLFLDGKDQGSLKTNDCEALFYADQGGEQEYQHFQTVTKEIPVKTPQSLIGFELKNKRLDYRFSDSFRDTDFSISGRIRNTPEPIIKRTMKIVETVDCTRDSHCPANVLFQGKVIGSTCNLLVHKCSVGQTYYNPPIPKRNFEIPWFGIIIIAVLGILLLILIKYSDRIFTRK